MRKGFLVALIIFLFFPVFSQDLPENFKGIWEGKDRFVFFEQFLDDKNPELVLLLKEYYGWYIDRTAEPLEYSNKTQRTRNTGTTKYAEHIGISFIEGIKTNNSWEGLIKLDFSKSQKNYIPVCEIDEKIYLNYYIKDSENPLFYKGGIVSKGITVDKQEIPENIACFIIDENKMYNVRYWKTDMEYSDEKVLFKYGEDEYQIPKHIISGETLYSCVTGRSKKVRNTQPSTLFIKENYIWNDKENIFAIDNEPYLYKLSEHKTYDDLIDIVKIQNSKRKPDPPPLFPPAI